MSKPVVNFMRAYVVREKEKDPIIDRVHTLMQDTGYTVARIEREGGAKASTVRNWIDGPTRKPQYANVVATLRSMGFDMFVGPMLDKPVGEKNKITAAMPSVVNKRFRSSELHH